MYGPQNGKQKFSINKCTGMHIGAKNPHCTYTSIIDISNQERDLRVIKKYNSLNSIASTYYSAAVKEKLHVKD